MNRLALGLLALAGCNRIFGLDELGTLDAVPQVDGNLPRFHLLHQVASTRVVAPAVIGSPVIATAPLPAGTTVRVSSDAKLLDAATYLPTGEVDIALTDPFTKRWSVEYTLPGEVPHEVSWAPLEGATLVVPVIGRLERTPMPSSSGWDVQPVGTNPAPPGPTAFAGSHIFTTGVFVDASTGTTPSAAKLDQPNTRFDGDILSQPDAAQGDHAIVVDYRVDGAGVCPLLARGYAGFSPVPLVANMQTAPNPQPTWQQPPTKTVTFDYTNLGPLGLAMRLNLALDTRSTASVTSRLEAGLIANRDVFAFTRDDNHVPAPLLFALATCNLNASSAQFIFPTDLDAFPAVTYARFTNERSVDGAPLVSSIVTLNTFDHGLMPAPAVVDFGVPFLVKPVLADGNTEIPLDGGADGVPLTAGPGTLALKLDLEAKTAQLDSKVDVIEVAVVLIRNGKYVPQRVYVTTAVEVTPGTDRVAAPIILDRSLFESGNQYVLELRAIRGLPGASVGRLDKVGLPLAISTIVTRSIRVP